MTTAQPGWYPDPEAPGAMRWWDGAQWTGHRHTPAAPTAYGAPGTGVPQAAPYSTASYGSLKAPEGTEWSTSWIWLIVAIPLVPVLALLTVDWTSLIDVNDRTGLSALRLFVSPGYLIAMLGGWVGYGLCVWFAYRDFEELAARGVPRPFHWAWAFLSSIVYVIGRSVVVRRRTGTGSAPLWAAIASIALMFAVITYVTVAMVLGVVDGVSQLTR